MAHIAEVEILNFKLYLKLEAKVYEPNVAEVFSPNKMIHDIIKLH